MKLVLIRHAEAVPVGTDNVVSDYDRFLTDRGRQQSEALAAGFGRLGLTPGLILSSPLVRAWQTAEILAATLTPGREPTRCDRLGLDENRFGKLSREVEEGAEDVTFLVGHMPNMGAYADWLLGAEGGAVDFSKAAAALIRFRGPPVKNAGQLRWLVPPAWFMV